MKRPLLIIGFSYLLSSLTAIYLGAFCTQILAVAFIFLFITSLFFKKARVQKVLPLTFLTISIALFSYSFCYYKDVAPIETLDGKDAQISGTICDLPYKSYNRYYYTVKVNKLIIDEEEKPVNMKIRLSLSCALDGDLYDEVNGKVHLFLPNDSEGFSSRSYYLARKISMFAYLYEYEDYYVQHVETKPPYYYLLKIRESLILKFSELFSGDYAHFATGILLGEKSMLSNSIKSDFREIGISHLLAVSGLHLSIILNFAFGILLFLKVKRKYTALICCILTFLFMGITGFSPSITRAGIMYIIYFLGIFLAKRPDSLNSLGISVCILTIFNPFAAGDIGLLLSVSSTLGILTLENKIELFLKSKIAVKNKFKDIVNFIISLASVTIAATIATFPIIILTFKRLSLVSILANLLIVPVSSLLMILLLICSILFFLVPIKCIFMPYVLLSSLIIKYILFISSILSKIPFAAISISEKFILVWLAFTLILFAVSLILYNNFKFIKITTLLSCIILLIGISSFQVINHGITQMALLNTGDGCSIVITKGKNSCVLSCGGDKYNFCVLNNYLESKNINKLDMLLLSDFDDKTAKYAQNLASEYTPASIIMPNNEYIDDKLSRSISDGSNVTLFKNDVQVKMLDNVKIRSLNLNKKGFSFLKINNVSILICPTKIKISDIPQQYTNCDIFIMGDIIKEYNQIHSLYTALPMDKENVNKNIEDIAKTGAQVLTTCDGNLTFNFYNDREISIVRN